MDRKLSNLTLSRAKDSILIIETSEGPVTIKVDSRVVFKIRAPKAIRITRKETLDKAVNAAVETANELRGGRDE